MPNPAFNADEIGGETTQDTLAGDGDGDPSTGDGDGAPGDGDGDGAPGDGDGTPGDGDGTPGDGDGDGDGTPGDGDGDGDPGTCSDGEMLCNGICINLDIDPLNCGQCGNGCPEQQLCSIGTCAPIRYVFATETTFVGAISSIGGGDAICHDSAQFAQLTGNYKAWLSDEQQWPADTFNNGPAVYVLRTGDVVAYSFEQLLSGQLVNPINRTEYGEIVTPTPACDGLVEHAVWTGTNALGKPALPNCSNWSLDGNLPTGRVGNAMATDATWTATDCLPLCNTPLRIYCIGQ